MAYVTTIEDEQERAIAELVSTFHRYQFADGSSMFIRTSPAWCRGFQAFVMVEELVDPSELESRSKAFWADREEHPLFSPDLVPDRRAAGDESKAPRAVA